MAIHRLPPPPANPVRSPAVPVVGEEAIRLTGRGVPSLEARVRVPVGATRAVVLCHPHPLYGGSMHSPVILALTKVLAELAPESVATLRFNFRGVPTSEGTYDDGRGETEDVRAAIDEIRRRAPGAKVSVAGHSFGSWTGLRAAAADGGVERVALVAPSTRFFDFEGAAPARSIADVGQLAVFIGDKDEFSTVDEARALAESLGASITVLEGNDHHFMKSRRKMAELVIPFIAPEVRVP